VFSWFLLMMALRACFPAGTLKQFSSQKTSISLNPMPHPLVESMLISHPTSSASAFRSMTAMTTDVVRTVAVGRLRLATVVSVIQTAVKRAAASKQAILSLR
jgi:hypothetical protein